MALYIVVHHRRDPHQPWQNDWLDDSRLQAITTTAEIGRLCEQAQQRNEAVFVHRCAWGGITPTLCCSVQVAQIEHIDRRTDLVAFTNAMPISTDPLMSPTRGQNFYIAEAL